MLGRPMASAKPRRYPDPMPVGRIAILRRMVSADHRWTARLAAVLLAPALAMLACGPSAREKRAADPRPDLLLISLDTTRADHLSAYGYGRPTSRRLEALAAEGVRFDRAYAPSATTGPTHATLFTSVHPITHGVRKNGHVLGDAFETLAGLLGGVGYETGGVASSYVLNAKFGYGRGFDRYDDDLSQAETPSGVRLWEGIQVEGHFYGRADDTTRRALELLDQREDPSRPFFLFVHYFDPHDPYTPPPGYTPPFSPGPKEALKLNRTIFRYDTLIAYTDQEIGRLLDGLRERGLAEDTVVMVVADHGEGLMQRGHMAHGVHVYEEAVRVPFIVRWPGRLRAGKVVEAPVALLDVAPTFLGLAGLEGGAAFRGRDLSPVLRGDVAEPDARPIYLYRRTYAGGEVSPGVYAKGEKFGVRDGRWKLIEGPEEGTLELYDLLTDPQELRNLAASEPDRVEALRGRLEAFRAEHERDGGGAAPISPEDRARLKALGYGE